MLVLHIAKTFFNLLDLEIHKMRYPDGRPDHIEDFLASYRTGQWYTFSDNKNKIYSNLVVLDGGSKPTETECTDGLSAMQSSWDYENDSYRSKRRDKYPFIEEQLDLLYHDIANGKLGVAATTGSWFVGITSVKNAIPKT